MALGSFSSGALYEISIEDVDRMLGLDETLFVEHKAGIGTNESFKVLQAIAAFANTAGGWLLVGVHGGRITADSESLWAKSDAPPLIDIVRDRLRGRVDPLPAFEAKVFDKHPGGPVGVIRVYESSDTPHIALENGAVYVREAAGVRDAANPKRPGARAVADRHYEAVKLGSRAELLELATRGRAAEARVSQLLNIGVVSPVIAKLGLRFVVDQDGWRPYAGDHGIIHVRIAPYTLSPRFRGWATTLDAADSVRVAAEALADCHGLVSDFVTPEPAGASISVAHSKPPHGDGFHQTSAQGRVAVDGAGVAGASLQLGPLDPNQSFPKRFLVDEIADHLITPVIEAAASVLNAGEFVGRSRCQIDLVGLQNVLRIESQGDHGSIAGWVPTTVDVTLTASYADLNAAALTAARALARSAGLPFWDSVH